MCDRVVQLDLFGSKGLIMFMKDLEPSNYSSSSMYNFKDGVFCRFLWSYSPKTCLNCLTYIQYNICNQYTKK